MSIKVISYNIHSGIGIDNVFDYGRIGEFLASQKADIVCLQEMDLRALNLDKHEQIERLKANYFTEFIASPAVFTESGWYGNALLSRFAHLSQRSVDISVETRQPRNIQDVLFNINGHKLRILNTHKGLKQHERFAQFTQLNAVVNEIISEDDTPLLVAGDFNEWQFFPRTLRRINKTLRPIPLGPTFPNKFPLFKLDRFWCKPDQLVQQARVLKTPETRVYSDHYPIQAELNFELR
ncbi:endonuclease/exonuclease/phosphatase family protein [Aliiglaciecola lipolytica]|uniref:Endonuclease/exonuclease/phosphatase n=1 Tax=Aliiglaciecola lipolytica E3 TaxID=1127673 RepID=K6YDH6_9ALTE|nr:endonuclease/exonuclease/phosphatase family protein [Aliiglaciecola lipolytica]GAC16247.1 endonuclease/exonuclease/phosphatase [Aliiglaciecola lipolytica E3]